jgi:hypothetical protein
LRPALANLKKPLLGSPSQGRPALLSLKANYEGYIAREMCCHEPYRCPHTPHSPGSTIFW